MATDRMILGENVIYSTDCNVTGLNNNVLVCGSSGCGKTMSISEPRLLETQHSSLIATVTTWQRKTPVALQSLAGSPFGNFPLKQQAVCLVP